MKALNLPPYEFRLRETAGQKQIFDEIRKKYVALTPEEWVRQHFVRFLVEEKGVPAGLMAMEKSLTYNAMQRRPDIVAHDRHGQALMIVECKAPEVSIRQETFDQIAKYNAVLHVPFLVVTNGLKHYCCWMDYDKQSYRFLPDIPSFMEMTAPQG